jgi:hypothetical protein
VVLTPRRWCQVGGGNSAGDGVNKPITGESTKETVKTIARGMSGETDVTVVTILVCFLHFAREAAGALGARHSLRPLISQGQEFKAKLARNTRRDREAVSARRGLKIEVDAQANTLVMPGLDPGIHPSSQKFFWQTMDRRERRQVYVVCARQTTMPGNDGVGITPRPAASRHGAATT